MYGAKPRASVVITCDPRRDPDEMGRADWLMLMMTGLFLAVHEASVSGPGLGRSPSSGFTQLTSGVHMIVDARGKLLDLQLCQGSITLC